jgi:excisionase family DNA binding protein
MDKTNKDNKFLTVAEVSDILRLSVLTIYKYIKSGKITAFEFGGHYRISTVSLNEFIQKHRLEGNNEEENE